MSSMPKYAKIVTSKQLAKRLTNIHDALLQLPKQDIEVRMVLDKVNILDYKNYDDLCVCWVSLARSTDIHPFYLAIYIDTQNRIRAFIPQRGNTYNPWTYTNFGSESSFPNNRHSITNMPDIYYQQDTERGGYKETEAYNRDFKDLEANWDLMTEELKKYIKVTS